mgnify:CR=1 FL=1
MKYNIITLCGSTLFYNEFISTQQTLESNGIITLIPSFFSKSRDKKLWSQLPQEKKDMMIAALKDIHFRKIDISDAILVIDVGQYIGDAIQDEITYAEANGKDVLYWSQLEEEEYDE